MLSRDKWVGLLLLAAIGAMFFGGATTAYQHSHKEKPKWKCEGYVALTYDDGPTVVTKRLVDSLKSEGMVATFFWKGSALEKRGEVAQYADKQGFQSGNHTWTHPHLPKDGKVIAELAKTQHEIESLGLTTSIYRPPYGDTNEEVQSMALSLGLSEVIWTLDTQDWQGRTADQIAETVGSAKDGDIILMHDNDQADLDAVPLISAALREKGLCTGFVQPSAESKTAWDGLTFDASVVKP